MGLGEVVAEAVATPLFRGSGNNVCHTTEGIYGRLKNELFHHRDWSGMALNEFGGRLGEHLEY